MIQENYIEWYEDDEIKITFSEEPDVLMRFATPYMNETEKEEINKKPFICLNKINVNIFDYVEQKIYNFDIPKNYTWDGASIPRMFWRFIGPKTDPKFLIPSMVHDILCENHDFVDYDRYLADRTFEKLLQVSGVSPFKRWLIFHSVDNFQKFCKWGI